MREAPTFSVVGDAGVRLSGRDLAGPDVRSPALVLHHGLASSQHIWDQLLPALTRRHRVVTYDARGHGRSAKPASGYGFDHVTADALAVVRSRQLRRPVLVGHSWGAMVALEFAVRRPRAIGGAVLVDGGVRSLREEMDWPTTKERLAPPHLVGMPLDEFRALMRTLLGEAVELTPEVESQVLSLMHVRADGTIAPRLARSNHFRILRAIWEQDPLDLWARIRVPTLAIVAHGAGDAAATRRTRAAVARVRERTGGRPVSIAWMRGIHDLPLQHPEALAARIDRFVRTGVR
jgi:pimeloyl-ACP methyl ester carboxylesterase